MSAKFYTLGSNMFLTLSLEAKLMLPKIKETNMQNHKEHILSALDIKIDIHSISNSV